MSNDKRMIGGLSFSTKGELEDALRDQIKIKELRASIDFTNYAQVQELSQQIASGKFQFEGALGAGFDDEVYELSIALSKQIKNNPNVEHGKSRNPLRSKLSKSNLKTSINLEDFSESMQEDIKIEINKKEKKRKLIAIISTFVVIFSVGYLSINTYKEAKTDAKMREYAQSEGNGAYNNNSEVKFYINKDTNEEIALTVLKEYEGRYKQNKKLIGWLKIDDTIIDYPVMQTSNNEYYLNHNFEQDKDKNGSIFMDYQCDPLKPSTNLILYGHHMNSGKMFGGLVKYKSESYYKKHDIIQFDTIYEKGSYQIMYVFPAEVYSEEEIVFKYYQFFEALSEEEFNSNMKEMNKMSLYDTGVRASYGDELLTLSTCDYDKENARFVVVAKKIQ